MPLPKKRRSARLWLSSLFAAACAVTWFYLSTAIVWSCCEISHYLAVKPRPGLQLEYGGERAANKWEREHPGEPPPWWLDYENMTQLAWGSPENPETMWWYGLYWSGILLVPILWLACFVLGAFMVASFLWRIGRRHAAAHSPH